ncbi:MAG: histidine phosphatase family protein [Austwickia sp.]|nr:MAG: histidine phosphatase family protein [Austwickia sp.]
MRLLMIRHGQTPSNVLHALDTAVPGADLTDLGRAQAAALPDALAGESIDAIVASTLVRTQQTAEPLASARGLQLIVRPGFREIAAGDLEMRTDEDAMRTYVDVVFSWPEQLDRRMPGGESGREVMARCDGVVAEAAAAGHNDVVILAHGAVIRAYAAARAHNVDWEYAAKHWLRNTGMVVLEGDPTGGWEMTRWVEHPVGGEHLNGELIEDPTGAPEYETKH